MCPCLIMLFSMCVQDDIAEQKKWGFGANGPQIKYRALL